MRLGEVPPLRRRLAQRLKGLRQEAGLTTTELAKRLRHSQSSISRIENALQVTDLATVEHWCTATGASASERKELLELARAVSSEVVEWRRATRRGLAPLQSDVRQLESSATAIFTYSPVLIPGLLQTADVARRVFSDLHLRRGDIAEAVAGRLERQAILLDQSTRLEFVIAEAGLRWRLGPPEVMLAQLERIVSVSRIPHIRLGIIPLATEAPAWPAHAFHLYERGEGPVVTVETMTSGLSLTSAADVEAFREAWARLAATAVFGADATAVLDRIMADYRQEISA